MVYSCFKQYPSSWHPSDLCLPADCSHVLRQLPCTPAQRPPARPLSRDYVNPYLPVGPTAGDDTLPIQAPLNVSPIESSVLLCTVDNAQYPVTVEAVHQVFSPYGLVHKIAIFDRNDSWQVGSGAAAGRNLAGLYSGRLM